MVTCIHYCLPQNSPVMTSPLRMTEGPQYAAYTILDTFTKQLTVFPSVPGHLGMSVWARESRKESGEPTHTFNGLKRMHAVNCLSTCLTIVLCFPEVHLLYDAQDTYILTIRCKIVPKAVWKVGSDSCQNEHWDVCSAGTSCLGRAGKHKRVSQLLGGCVLTCKQINNYSVETSSVRFYYFHFIWFWQTVCLTVYILYVYCTIYIFCIK